LISDENIRIPLHKLDFRVIHPVLSIHSPDEQYEVDAEHLRAFQKLVREGRTILCHKDEIDHNLLFGLIRYRTRRGSQRKILNPGQNDKLYSVGAAHFMTGRLTYRVGECKNSVGYIALLKHIFAEYCLDEIYTGPKIGLVVDNYILHRSKKTQAVLDQYEDRIKINPLPTYSPKLNLIEKLWKYLLRKVTHNHLFASIQNWPTLCSIS
jgi:hypothetical protein